MPFPSDCQRSPRTRPKTSTRSLVACSGPSRTPCHGRETTVQGAIRSCPQLGSRLRSPRRFVAGLVGAWVPLEARGCLYVIPSQHPSNPFSHEHCLARWTARRGYRVTLCRNPHFDRILWHPDGGTALLNDGRIVARDGTVRARLRVIGPLVLRPLEAAAAPRRLATAGVEPCAGRSRRSRYRLAPGNRGVDDGSSTSPRPRLRHGATASLSSSPGAASSGVSAAGGGTGAAGADPRGTSR